MRALPPLEPSARFRRGLRGRLAVQRGGEPVTVSGTARVAAALLVAIAATLLILEGIAASSGDRFASRELPPPMVVVNPGVPFVRFAPAPAIPAGLSEPSDPASRAASVAP